MANNTIDLLGDYTEGEIDALAFNIGKLLSHVIETTVKNETDDIYDWESKVLDFRDILKSYLEVKDNKLDLLHAFDNHFGIVRAVAENSTQF